MIHCPSYLLPHSSPYYKLFLLLIKLNFGDWETLPLILADIKGFAVPASLFTKLSLPFEPSLHKLPILSTFNVEKHIHVCCFCVLSNILSLFQFLSDLVCFQ